MNASVHFAPNGAPVPFIGIEYYRHLAPNGAKNISVHNEVS